ncbi:MAG: hypothetical protein ABIQ64_03795 [Candidatus Saccharimonadales bacterium]
MRERDHHFSPEKQFFLEHGIKYTDSHAKLPPASVWEAIDDNMTIRDLLAVNDLGESLIDELTKIYDKGVFVLPSDSEATRVVAEPLYAIVGARQVDKTQFDYDLLAGGELWEQFGSLENGHIPRSFDDVPPGWKCLYRTISYAKALVSIDSLQQFSRHWCVTPAKDTGGNLKHGLVSLWVEPILMDIPQNLPRSAAMGGIRYLSDGALLALLPPIK